jgi:hypothetical protein
MNPTDARNLVMSPELKSAASVLRLLARLAAAGAVMIGTLLAAPAAVAQGKVEKTQHHVWRVSDPTTALSISPFSRVSSKPKGST